MLKQIHPIAIFLVILVLCITIAIIAFIFATHGTPWEKSAAISAVQHYLDSKYKYKKNALKAFYDVSQDVYIVVCSSKDNEGLVFEVFYRRNDGKIGNDTYYLRYFENDINLKFNKCAKQIFGENVTGGAHFSTRNVDNLKISNLNEDIQLQDITKNINKEFNYDVIIKYAFNKMNIYEDSEKMYCLIDHIKTQEYMPDRIYLSYQSLEEDSSFQINFDYDDYISVNSVDDVLSFIDTKLK